MTTRMYLDSDQINAGVAAAGASPRRAGTVDMIVRRPDVDAREVLDSARWVNRFKELRRRGLDAAVVAAGNVAAGDTICVIE